MGKNRRQGTLRAVACVLAIVLYGCDDESSNDEVCRQDDASGCRGGLVCEKLGASRFECLAPVVVSGRVYGALDGAGIAGATVVGLDANGAARTRVVRSGADGTYTLPVSVPRDEEGVPLAEAITLRVAASDHQPFPTAPRSALPVRLETAALQTDRTYRLVNAATDVSLVALPADRRGGVTVEGKVEGETPSGVLVLGVVEGVARSSAVSDLDGSFVLFNVPPGALRIEGYRAGLSLEPEALEVPAGGLGGVTVSPAMSTPSAVTGMVSIVNASGGLTTSVILVVASTFDARTARGEAPAGLRAADVSGAFRIEGVPPGRYAVLAGFENDQLVRDPDEGIGGTEIVYVDVGSGGATVALPESFKVTQALAVVSPGADAVQHVQRGSVPLVWADDSSEDGYELRVYDALGNLVHENTAVPRVSGAATVTYALDTSSAAYVPGMLYQFRVWSYRDRQPRTFISATEDLRGLFQLVP